MGPLPPLNARPMPRPSRATIGSMTVDVLGFVSDGTSWTVHERSGRLHSPGVLVLLVVYQGPFPMDMVGRQHPLSIHLSRGTVLESKAIIERWAITRKLLGGRWEAEVVLRVLDDEPGIRIARAISEMRVEGGQVTYGTPAAALSPWPGRIAELAECAVFAGVVAGACWQWLAQ